jgi:hypothetical protein
MNPQRTLADFCEWWPEGERRPCYAQAGLVLVRPSGQTLAFRLRRAPAGLGQPHPGPVSRARARRVEAQGAGYRGAALGG